MKKDIIALIVTIIVSLCYAGAFNLDNAFLRGLCAGLAGGIVTFLALRAFSFLDED